LNGVSRLQSTSRAPIDFADSESVAPQSYSGPSVTISIGGGDDDDAANTAAEATAEAARQQSQDATDITNAGIAQTAQGINGP
jgi:hypothetical protein